MADTYIDQDKIETMYDLAGVNSAQIINVALTALNHKEQGKPNLSAI